MSIAELNGAKQLVQQDPNLYPTVVDSLLSIADRPEPALRRWCALFFMDALTSLELADSVKTDLAIKMLPKIDLLVSDRDPQVLKIALGCISHAYPMIFRYLCRSPRKDIWDYVTSIKHKSSETWDDSRNIGVQASCIKLAQVTVQTQSKQREGTEPNLQDVPQNHVFLDPVYLHAEAEGLLDRIIGYFSSHTLQPALLSASLSAALTLVIARPQMGPKIINSICSMNLAQKSGLDTQVSLRFVDKSLQLDLKYIARIVPQFAQPISRFLARTAEFSASANLRKRAATQEGEDSSKRVKLSQNDWPVDTKTSLPEGTYPLYELYKLVDEKNVLAQFNARDLPVDVAVKMALSGLKNANPTLLGNCISIIKKRISGVEIIKQGENDTVVDGAAAAVSAPAPAAAEASTSAEPAPKQEQVLTISLSETDEFSKKTADLVNRVVRAAAETTVEVPEEPGMERHIRWSKDSWVYLISRIATRAVPDDSIMAQRIREYLYKYVMTDFRKYLDLIVIWLSEEWYAENVLNKQEGQEENNPNGIYFETLGRIIDQILPRMEVSDSKMFIRLLSDVPALNADIISKLKSICQDPDRSPLGVRALKFLIMLKPPIKSACLDLVQELHQENMDGMEPILKRYRPEVLA